VLSPPSALAAPRLDFAKALDSLPYMILVRSRFVLKNFWILENPSRSPIMGDLG
jgi:hypothetical protein